MLMRMHRTQLGMTLVEVMVALAILATAVGALIKAGTSANHSFIYYQQKTLAHYVALNQLARFELDKSSISPKVERGREQMAQQEWFWQATIQQTENSDIFEVIIKVGLDNDEDNQLASLKYYLDKSPSSGSVT